MWNKKSTAVVLAGLLIFALFVSGGCLGGSDNSSNNFDKVTLIEAVTDEDRATFKDENIELLAYKKGQIKKTRSVLVSEVESLTDEQKAELKEMFAEKGAAVVSILDPKNIDIITALKAELLGKHKNNAIVKEESLLLDKDGKKLEHARVRVYSIMKDDEGQTHSYGGIVYDTDATFDALHRNDNIRQEDIDDGKVWVKCNRETGAYNVLSYKRIPVESKTGEKPLYYNVEEIVLGQVAEGDITVGSDNIKVKFQGDNKDCLSFEKEHALYEVLRKGIELSDKEETRVEKIADDGEKTAETDKPTKEERIAKAKYNSLKNYIKWTREKKQTKEQALVQAGCIKPRTRFEKFMAWAKDILASNGIAFAEDEKVNLFDVAQSYSGTVSSFYENLPGFNMCVNTYIVGMHQFVGSTDDEGNDIYYVTEKCIFTNALESYYNNHWYEHGSYYSHIAEANNDSAKFYPNGAECDEGYVGGYTVETKLNGNCKVVGHWSQPDTYNNVTSKSVSHGWNIGGSGDVGVEAGKDTTLSVGLALSGGYECSESEEYQTLDVDATEYDYTPTKLGKITIKHTVNKIPERGSPWRTLTYPADLAKSTYNPMQTFVWQMATNDRSKYADAGFNIDVDASVCGAYSHNSGSRNPEYYTMTANLSGDILIPMPPRFCLDKDIVNFDDGEKKTDHIVIYSQGKWEIVDKDSVPSWIVLTGENKEQLTIEVKPNKTGKTREAYVTVRRVGGTESFDERVIYITQSMYSK